MASPPLPLLLTSHIVVQPTTTKQTLPPSTHMSAAGLAHPLRALSFYLRDPWVSTKLHSPTLTARNTFQAPILVPRSQAAACRLRMTTSMLHEAGKRLPFDSIQLHQCVLTAMCIIDIDNDFRIKIPSGDMIEKSMSFPPFLFLPSSTAVCHPVVASLLACLYK